MRNIVTSIRQNLAEVMDDLGIDKSDWAPLLTLATDTTHGDVAMPCHSLARVLKKSPVVIAEEISVSCRDKISPIAEVDSINGFLNFTATQNWLENAVADVASDDKFGVNIEKQRIIVIDYSSPNVAKTMHVGHLRSTVIGDALNRMLTYKGHHVVPENHIGDWGTPFGMLIEHYLELESVAVEDIDLESFYKQARLKFDEDQDFANKSRNRVVKLQSGDEYTLELWQQLVDISLVHFNDVYQKLGVLLTDKDLAGESKYEILLPEVVTRLEQANLLAFSQGAEVVFPEGWVNREGEPLPLIIRKGDGGFNYATTDLACIIDRVENIGSSEFLYVVGQEQKQHFAMVFEVARNAGFMDESVRAVHIPFGMVLGTDGKKLASRGGLAISLKDLLDEAVLRADAAITEKNQELTESERAKIARMIGIGAVKYSDLSSDRTKDYTFDWDKMLSFEGNTSPYLQYAHARICSIFKKSGIKRESTRKSVINLVEPSELALGRSIIGFAEALDDSCEKYLPHRLATYLHSLAQSFAAFYENCHVLIAEEESVKLSRLALCDLTARILNTGLDLLGIESPEQM